MTRIALIVLASFGAGLGAFFLLRDGGPRVPLTPHFDAGASLRPGSSTSDRVRAVQRALRVEPRRSDGWTMLAAGYLQRARETADPTYYDRADGAVRRALALAPDNLSAKVQQGTLANARHDFRGGLANARAARRLAPDTNAPFAVLVDSLIELGRYPEAERALQTMADRKPDVAALTRVSYWRELHGDLAGAVRFMRDADSAGAEIAENGVYVQTRIGDLELQRGHVKAARREYTEALYRNPRYVLAEAGLARVDIARGRLGPAIARLRDVIQRLPSPEFIVLLGETELAAGRRAAGERDLELVRAQERLLAGAGVNVDVDVALYEADHGDPQKAVTLARRARQAAPSVRSADALGWALTRAGHPREGLRWARRAMALDSRDPRFLYHAGMTAAAAGAKPEARRWLSLALAGNPQFSAYHAPRALRALEALR